MFFAIFVNCLVVAIAVMIHYEFLARLSALMRWRPLKPKFRILLGVFGSLIAHSIEVWVFALAYYGLIQMGGFGHFEGNFGGSLMDCVYFSFTTFTTLGFGDIEPNGLIRFLTGIESLTGLVLITWTASYLFLEMQKHWD